MNHSASVPIDMQNSTSQLKERGVDFLFRCNHCIKLVPDTAPIYMRHDSSYCSTSCREKGVSSLYTSLVGQQLKLLSQKDDVSLMNVKSDSSIHSRFSEQSEDKEEQRGVHRRILQRIGEAILSRVVPSISRSTAGDRILRTYSSGLVWGKEYTRNSSFNWLFQYMPEIDEYWEPGMDDPHASSSSAGPPAMSPEDEPERVGTEEENSSNSARSSSLRKSQGDLNKLVPPRCEDPPEETNSPSSPMVQVQG